jgi:preprotein translocase subunit SecG
MVSCLMNIFSVQKEGPLMNGMEVSQILPRIVLLLGTLGLGLWFIASGLQAIIGDQSGPSGLQIFTFVLGLVFFFGGIATGIIVLAPPRK